MAYLDDVYFMGPTTDTLGALMRFEEFAGQIGLTVNRSKTELLCSVEECAAVSTSGGNKWTSVGMVVLGTPVGSCQYE